MYLVMLAAVLLFASQAFGNVGIEISGQQKFSPGDNPFWADPMYDDSDWKEIEVPGSWQSQGLEPKNGMGWYRIYFELPAERDRLPTGISLGWIGDADETFLNGTRIGGEGRVGKNFVEATFVERLYKIPPDLLRVSGANLLAIRVLNTYGEGGIYSGRIVLGNYSDLLTEKLKRSGQTKIVEAVILTFFLLFFLVWCLLYILGVRDREYLYFGLFLTAFLLSQIFDGLIFYDLHKKTPLIQRIIFVLYALLPPVIMLFLASVFRHPTGRLLKIILLFSFGVALLISFTGNADAASFGLLLVLWLGSIILLLGYGLYILSGVIRRGVRVSPALYAGIVSIYAAASSEIATALFIIPKSRFFGLISVTMFMFAILYLMVRRFVLIRQHERQLSGKILNVQDEERKRLARELHDGLGHDLLMIKYNLQKVNQTLGIEDMKSIIKDVDRCVVELREISSGLRPRLLEEMGLEMAITSYCGNLKRKTGVDVQIKGRIRCRLPDHIEDNLFRIIQEAIGNAVKHSDSETIQVNIEESAAHMIVEVVDRGCGFSTDASLGGRGIGISTIRERIELIGGHLHIRSRPGKGTTVRIEVPLQ